MRGSRHPVHVLRLGALLLALAVGLAGPARSQAQEAAPVLAILDVQKVLRESVAVKALTKEIEEQREGYQAQLREKEEAVRAADKELARQRTILSAEAFAQKRGELEKEVAALQREVQTRKRDLDQAFGNGMAQVQNALAGVAKEIAEERGIDLVLSKATVVIVKPKFDITGEAVKRLNARLTTVAAPALQN